MSSPTGIAVIAAAVIGAGATAYSMDEQKKMQNDADRKRKEMADAERARLDAIAGDTKPTEEGATIDFGGTDIGDGMGAYDDFLVDKGSSSALGSTGGSGVSASSGGLASLAMK